MQYSNTYFSVALAQAPSGRLVEVEAHPVEVEVRRVEVEAEVEAVALDPRAAVVVLPPVALDVANASASRVTVPRPPSS